MSHRNSWYSNLVSLSELEMFWFTGSPAVNEVEWYHSSDSLSNFNFNVFLTDRTRCGIFGSGDRKM